MAIAVAGKETALPVTGRLSQADKRFRARPIRPTTPTPHEAPTTARPRSPKETAVAFVRKTENG